MRDTILKKIGQGFNWLAASADNHKAGASGRKITAIVIVALMIHGHLHWVNHDNYYDIHSLDVVFVSILLGIVTVEQIIKLLAAKSGTTVKEEISMKSTVTTEEKTDQPT